MADSKRNKNRCSFCGRTEDEVGFLITGMNGYICDSCATQAYEITQEALGGAKRSGAATKLNLRELPKPLEIKEFLDQYVIGQDDAKRFLSVSVYNHYKRLLQKDGGDDVEIEKSNIIMVGSTGTGKTLLARTIAKLLHVPFTIVDATVLTEAGYVGEDIESILTRLLQVADYNVPEAEQGIVFIDEIDKIAGRNNTSGADVSREGVQRDILPIVEGATVKTKYGQMKTDHILFIAAGAFHVSKPSDLIPELQGRFPVRVELSSLTKEDLRKILTEPRQALIRQYESLLETEGVTITFTESSLDAIAEIATHVNEETEDIGARRLYTILERVLEDISFEAPDLEDKNVTIDGDYIREKMGRITQDIDVSNYIL